MPRASSQMRENENVMRTKHARRWRSVFFQRSTWAVSLVSFPTAMCCASGITAAYACKSLDYEAHVEHIWDDLREKYFVNRIFSSLDMLQELLCVALNELSSDTDALRSMTYFPHIRVACEKAI